MTELLKTKIDFKSSPLPIYQAVAEFLREEIMQGNLPLDTKLPSEDLLAAHWGINHQTLRKSFKILAEMNLIKQRHGCGTFVSYRAEQRLKIGVVVSNLDAISNDIYMMRMITGLTRAIKNEYAGEITLIDESQDLAEQINQLSCDALIVLYLHDNGKDFFSNRILDHIPTVFINFQDEALKQYGRYNIVTSRNMIHEAVTRLYRLGHRKIAYFSRDDKSSDLTLCYREFIAVCEKLGISAEYCATSENYWYHDARKAAEEMFSKTEHPTACVAPGYTFSCGAWQGIMDAKLRIPDDVSFIGFDTSSNSNPLMSAMMQPVDEITRKAVELVFELHRCNNRVKQREYEIPAVFVDNGSCRAIERL